jgi:hypothetical protein
VRGLNRQIGEAVLPFGSVFITPSGFVSIAIDIGVINSYGINLFLDSDSRQGVFPIFF